MIQQQQQQTNQWVCDPSATNLVWFDCWGALALTNIWMGRPVTYFLSGENAQAFKVDQEQEMYIEGGKKYSVIRKLVNKRFMKNKGMC